MTTREHDDLDRLLEREFGQAFRPVADDGFTEQLLRRLRRRSLIRALALGGALAAGLAIALGPILDVVAIIDDLSPWLTDAWRHVDISAQHRYTVIAVLLGLVSPLLIRFLER